MNNFFKKASAVLFSGILLCMNFTVSADDTGSDKDTFTDNVITYEKISGGVRILSCDKSTSYVEINEEIGGYKIISIADNAFSECSKLTEILLPDSITEMGTGVFQNCTSLKKVKFTSGIDTIPVQTFALCTSLEEVDIPENIKSIGSYAFSYCDNLTNFKIPSSVENIDSYAFASSNLGNTLDIPEGVKNISDTAFFSCEALTKVNIPKSIENISSLAFLGCINLQEYTLASGNNTYSVENGILYSHNNSVLENYPAGKTDKTFTIPNTVNTIADGAFFANISIEKLSVPDTVNHIGEGAFSNCSSLAEIVIPDSITELSPNLFSDCKRLWNVKIPASVTSIGNYAFLSCDNLKSIEIPDTVTSIGDYALGFYDETDDDGNSVFKKADNFEIKANFESAAKNYAKDNGISIDYLDGNGDLPFIIAVIAGGVIIAAVAVFITVKFILKKKNSEKQ